MRTAEWRDYIREWKASLAAGTVDKLMEKCYNCGGVKELLVSKTIFFAGAGMQLEMPLCRKCWRS